MQIVNIGITESQQNYLGGGWGLNNPSYLELNIVVFVNWEPAN